MSTATIEKAWELLSFLRACAQGPKSCEMHGNHANSCNSQDFGPAALIRKKDRNSNAFSMVAVLIFLPGHSKISFSMKILVPNQNFGDFHEISSNLGAESDFMGFEGSLAGPGGKP